MLACRPMIPLALAAMAGTLAARFLPALAALALPGAALSALALLLFFLRRPPGGSAAPAAFDQTPAQYLPHLLPSPGRIARRGTNAFILILCAAAFSFALWRQDAWREKLAPGSFPLREWHRATLVADAPQYERDGETGRWRAAARVLSVDGASLADPVPVRLYGTAKTPFQRGDTLRARIRLSLPAPQKFPGAFDSAFWLERDGLAANANAAYGGAGADAFDVIPAAAPSLLLRARRAIDAVRAAAIERTLRHGGEHGGMLAAMLYGYRAELPRETGDVFRRVGIGHTLAISGLHVGLVIGLLWWLSGWLPVPPRVRALLCLAASAVYLGLSGGQTAAARATLMAAVHLAAIALGRRTDMLNSLGAAAFLITLGNPTAPLDISFQLSFTAVVFLYIGISGWARSKPIYYSPLRKELDSLVRLSVTTWIGLYPICAYVFHQVNPVGLPINVIVIPMTGAVLVGGLLLPVLGRLPGAAALLTLPSALLTWCARAADALPYSSFPAQAPGGWWMAAFYAAVALSLLNRMIADGTRRRRFLLCCLAAIAAALAGTTLSMTSAPPPPEPRLAHIPGGSGLGVISAETPDGRMALVGEIRRQGLDEAEWLYSLRRSGKISLVTLGQGKRDTLAGLLFHYSAAAHPRLPLTRKRDANAPPAWTPVPAAPGVEYALVRNAKGRATALLVRSGDALIASTSSRFGRDGGEDARTFAAFLRKTREENPGLAVARVPVFAERTPAAARGVTLLTASGGVRVYYGNGWRTLLNSEPEYIH